METLKKLNNYTRNNNLFKNYLRKKKERMNGIKHE